MRNFTTVDPEISFASTGDIDLQRSSPTTEKKLLKRRALADSQFFVCAPLKHCHVLFSFLERTLSSGLVGPMLLSTDHRTISGGHIRGASNAIRALPKKYCPKGQSIRPDKSCRLRRRQLTAHHRFSATPRGKDHHPAVFRSRACTECRKILGCRRPAPMPPHPARPLFALPATSVPDRPMRPLAGNGLWVDSPKHFKASH